VHRAPIPLVGPVIDYEKVAPQFFDRDDQRPGVIAIV